MPQKPPPSSCPPLLAQLVEQEGGMIAAAKKTGVHCDGLRKIANGERELTLAMETKLKAALNGPVRVAGPALNAKPEPELPKMKLWDGKRADVIVAAKSGKTEKYKKVPVPLVNLLKKFGGSRIRAAEAMGFNSVATVTNVLRGEAQFGERLQEKVHRAMHGLPPASSNNDAFTAQDTFSRGIAICVISIVQYERLEDLAEVMGGTVVFKKSYGATGWIVIYAMSSRDKLQTFKRLAARDAKDIVCP